MAQFIDILDAVVFLTPVAFAAALALKFAVGLVAAR